MFQKLRKIHRKTPVSEPLSNKEVYLEPCQKYIQITKKGTSLQQKKPNAINGCSPNALAFNFEKVNKI